MATLQKIRSKGPLLVIVIGVALFAFIAGDAWRVFQPHQNNQNAGIINGEKLSAQEFQSMVEEETSVLELLYNRQLRDNDLAQLRDQIWQSYLSYKLIKEQADKLGLTVTDEEIANLINEGTSPLLNQTPFVNPQTRMFDKTIMEAIVSQAPRAEAALIMSSTEKQLKQALLANKYYALIQKSIIANPIATENSYNERMNESDVVLAMLPYSTIADSTITISDSEIKALYNKKKEQYKNDVETRDIQYIDYVVLPSEADRKQTLDEVTEATLELKNITDNYASVIRTTGSTVSYVDIPATKNGFPSDIAMRLDSVKVGEVYGPYYNSSDDSYNAFKLISKQLAPDSIEFRQIQVISNTLEATKTLADSITTALKGGANFAELAKKYNNTNGETQWIVSNQYEGQTIDPNYAKLFNALNTMSNNEVRNIDLGQGNIILQVTNRKGMTNKYKAAIIKRPIEFSNETYNTAYNKISQFLAANNNYDDFVKNAEDNGFNLRNYSQFRSDAHLINGVAGTTEALRWIFNANVKDVSQLYDCGNGDHLMIIALSHINKKGYKPISEVQNLLRAELLREKKAEQLKASFTNVNSFETVKQIKDIETDSITHISFAAPAFVSITRSNEPALSGLAEQVEIDQLSAPIKGNGGVFIFQPYNKNTLENEFNETTEANRLSNQYMGWASQFMGDLLLKANVEDTRYLYF